MQVRELALVREFWTPDPNPHEAVPLNHRITENLGLPVYALLPRHPDASTARIKLQPVVLADQMISL
jgi:hypothetical protein